MLDCCWYFIADGRQIYALAMLFSSYYIFNIQYPSDAEATLEFIQRCMVGINPDRGHKAEKKKNRTHHTNELY
ncbi:hypothetical protein Pmani_000062 [Petrolisthes manimaculis]|uniref:Uncharacterized protein n=1 Tax=Petrolisthes manimaculis TaxID=1843537 RepID=A0AAE1UDM3_9EUCA|nr:hypothetical protein Pmani_032718 [Petrolisthes manimaculis]KAK4316791.1 hypothetical protein Pmani_012094 [Petrolisthes manimaculis]KAK4329587.1 hypothetical protein Pmani_000062 [Petrolisthes manimaculis]